MPRLWRHTRPCGAAARASCRGVPLQRPRHLAAAPRCRPQYPLLHPLPAKQTAALASSLTYGNVRSPRRCRRLHSATQSSAPFLLARCSTAPASSRSRIFQRDIERRTYASTATASDMGVAVPPFRSVPPGLRMSMPPLKNAPSSIEIRAAITSPVREPSLRMSTRSLA